MTYETLIVETEDRVCLIRLNRPQALNALNARMLGELAEAVRVAEKDPAVRCLVITGSDKAFAAGADITEMAPKTFAETFTDNMYSDETDAILRCRKPIIAAVSGYALGGGCELALICDFIIASDTAKFGQPEINVGITAGLGGTQRLTRLVGKSKSMDMQLTGRFMDAIEAERAGLVSRVVPPAKLIPEAMAAARKIAEKPALAAMAVKESVNRSYETGLREGVLFERRLFNGLFATEDQKEGMRAFVEKRPPVFGDR